MKMYSTINHVIGNIWQHSTRLILHSPLKIKLKIDVIQSILKDIFYGIPHSVLGLRPGKLPVPEELRSTARITP